MRELVEVIAKSLVDYPDEVVVTQNETEKAIVIELRVAQSDMGKVIGKQGRIAKAIRAVVKAAASKVLTPVLNVKSFVSTIIPPYKASASISVKFTSSAAYCISSVTSSAAEEAYTS